MTKERFLGNLEYALKFMAQDERDATINFYSEMIDDRIEDGLNEEEAVAQMESPEDIATRLQKTQETTSNDKESDQGTDNDDGNNIGSWEKRLVTYPVSQVRIINVKSDNLPIHVCMDETSDEIKATYFTSQHDPYSITLDDGELTLTHKGAFERISSDFVTGLSDLMNNLSQMFSGGSYGSSGAFIDITLPKGYNGALSLIGSNARIHIDGVQCHTGITASTSNGRIQCNDCALDALKAQTSNARVECEDVKTRGNIELKSINGRLVARNCVAFGALQMTTSNGAVIVDDISSDDIRMKTSNGSVSGSVQGSQSDYAIDSATSNGHSNLPESTTGKKRLSVHTSNGSIRIRFEEE